MSPAPITFATQQSPTDWSHSWEAAVMPFTRSTEWVDATPVRTHARGLIVESNLPWRAVAVLAGVPARVVHSLVFARQQRSPRPIRAVDAARLLLVSHERARDLHRASVPAASTHATVWGVLSLGHSRPALAHWLETDTIGMQRLLSSSTCSARTALLATAAAQAAGLTADADLDVPADPAAYGSLVAA